MYTESQREKAIKFYIKYGLRAEPVNREIGYSFRLVFCDWIPDDVKNHK